MQKHRLSALFLSELQQTPWQHHIPSRLWKAWEEDYYRQLRRVVLVQDHLHRILGLFQRSGIESIVLKGGHLLEQYYPHPALRPLDDIDFLTHSRDRFALRPLLEEAGFRLFAASPMNEVPTAQKFVFLNSEGHPELYVEFDTDSRSPKRRNPSFTVGVEDFWRASLPSTVAGAPARVLDPTFNLLYLSVHLSEHCFSRLLWFYDLHLVLEKSGKEILWDELAVRAREYRCATPVYFALLFARKLFGSPVPEDALRALAPRLFKRILARPFISTGRVVQYKSSGSRSFALLQRFILNDNWTLALRCYFFHPSFYGRIAHPKSR